MSADFMSDMAIAPARTCERWYESLASRERVADIVGPDEETLFSFGGDGEPVLADLSAAYEHGQLPPPSEIGATYVDLDVKTWTAYTEIVQAQHMSSNYASLVVLDRAIAIPRGVLLLAGHAVRRIRNDELAGFQREWRGLVMRSGGSKGLAKHCRSWLDRGGFDVEELTEFIDAIGILTAQARTQGDDLLLAGYPVP